MMRPYSSNPQIHMILPLVQNRYVLFHDCDCLLQYIYLDRTKTQILIVQQFQPLDKKEGVICLVCIL